MTDQKSPTDAVKGVATQLPTDQLKKELQSLVKVAARRAASAASGRVQELGKNAVGAVTKGRSPAELTGAVTKKLAGAGVESIKDKVKEKLPGGGGGGGKGGQGAKVTNIVEEIDVGVPIDIAYDQWTRFTDFPGFMKKVENVEQESDTELKWRAQVLWSHRDWKSTIVEQVPDDRIVWKSEGAKGYVDGAVTFHDLGPNLTKILLVLKYYPQGFFEKTGNLWRAQGRRARLELKHFRRHVMTETILNPDELEGWRGEIRDSEVVKDHQQAMAEQAGEDQAEPEQGEDQAEPEQGEDQAEPEQGEDQAEPAGDGQPERQQSEGGPQSRQPAQER
jgi:hypothetical protein